MRENVVFGVFLACCVVAILAAGLLRSFSSSSGPPSDYCYFVTDVQGTEYPSYRPIQLAFEGAYWSTREGWGLVMSPLSLRTDKDCLRLRGVDVPPVEE